MSRLVAPLSRCALGSLASQGAPRAKVWEREEVEIVWEVDGNSVSHTITAVRASQYGVWKLSGAVQLGH